MSHCNVAKGSITVQEALDFVPKRQAWGGPDQVDAPGPVCACSSTGVALA